MSKNVTVKSLCVLEVKVVFKTAFSKVFCSMLVLEKYFNTMNKPHQVTFLYNLSAHFSAA